MVWYGAVAYHINNSSPTALPAFFTCLFPLTPKNNIRRELAIQGLATVMAQIVLPNLLLVLAVACGCS